MTFTPRHTEPEDWSISAPQYYRDMHAGGFIEAICGHGIGHHKGVHGCDGCCSTAPADVWDKVTDESKDGGE